MVVFVLTERPDALRGGDRSHLRLDAGVKQCDIARLMGVTPSVITRLELSLGWPRPPTVRRYLDALDSCQRKFQAVPT